MENQEAPIRSLQPGIMLLYIADNPYVFIPNGPLASSVFDYWNDFSDCFILVGVGYIFSVISHHIPSGKTYINTPPIANYLPILLDDFSPQFKKISSVTFRYFTINDNIGIVILRI